MAANSPPRPAEPQSHACLRPGLPGTQTPARHWPEPSASFQTIWLRRPRPAGRRTRSVTRRACWRHSQPARRIRRPRPGFTTCSAGRGLPRETSTVRAPRGPVCAKRFRSSSPSTSTSVKPRLARRSPCFGLPRRDGPQASTCSMRLASCRPPSNSLMTPRSPSSGRCSSTLAPRPRISTSPERSNCGTSAGCRRSRTASTRAGRNPIWIAQLPSTSE